MDKIMEKTMGFRVGMEKNMEITIMGYRRTTIRIHAFIPS